MDWYAGFNTEERFNSSCQGVEILRKAGVRKAYLSFGRWSNKSLKSKRKPAAASGQNAISLSFAA